MPPLSTVKTGMGKVYTTGEVARICGVAARTVCKWFDSGKLKGYRVPSGSDGSSKAMNRRICHDVLVKFLRDNGFPMKGLDRPSNVILFISPVEGEDSHLQEVMGKDYVIRSAQDCFSAGISLSTERPDAIITDFVLGRSEALGIAKSIRSFSDYPKVPILAILSEDTSEAEATAVLTAGYSGIVCRPYKMDLLVSSLKAQMGVEV